ncbi:MAG TPA: MFS transporter [Puia sp.]|nr:MFS transporter [Puia sp.]
MQLLLIRESESKIVSRLFIFEFFQGAAIALYFLSAISIFVEHLPASELPKVFILAAFFLWLFGFLYSRLEHGLLTRHLIYFVLIFNGLCIVFFRSLIHLQNEKWFLFIFLASFNVLYLLNNLEFWGLVAMLFDVRQGKRLFAIVSAWDGPARITGYLISFVLSTVIGIENLLWIAALFMLFSLLMFIPLARSEEMKTIAPSQHHHYATQSLQHIQASVTGNQLIRNVAVVSFFSFCFYLVTNFVLYGYLKKEFHNDTALARFFAVFLIASRGIALIIKPLFVNRILDKLGIQKSLLIAPVLLLILSISAVLLSQQEKVLFYIFLVMAITADILRSSIQSPILLATLQPLPVQQRLRGHTIIKGLMDPFAFLATGILLLLTLGSGTEVNLSLLSIILIAVTLLWIFFAISIDGIYIKTLTVAIRKRLLHGHDISISDTDSLHFLFKRLEEGGEDEGITILHLVSSNPSSRDIFYEKALQHSSFNVRQIALKNIQAQHCQALLPALKKMLLNPDYREHLPQLLQCISVLDAAEDISSYLDHEDKEVSDTTVILLLSHQDHPKKSMAINYLFKLFGSSSRDNILSALKIVGELKLDQFYDEVHQLTSHMDESIRQYAFRVTGKLARENELLHLLQDYTKSAEDKYILESLQFAGESALLPIQNSLLTEKFSRAKRRQLFILIGKIGGDIALDHLEKYLNQFPDDEYQLLSILFQQRFMAGMNGYDYRDSIHKKLNIAAAHVYGLNILSGQPQQYTLLIQAMELELQEIRDKCLFLFSFLYDADKIRRAKMGFELNAKESSANAYELIAVTVEKEYANLFTLIFEPEDLSNKCIHLAKYFKETFFSVDSLVEDILRDEMKKYNDWTKSVCFYIFKDQKRLMKEYLVMPYLSNEDPILKETAELVLENIHH